jgi:hypothetical protein
VRRVLLALLVLIVLGVGGAYYAIRHLDTGFVKTRLQSLVHDQAGLDLDYADAQAQLLTGLHLKNVTVASPPELRPVAPVLLRADDLQLGWSFLGGGQLLNKVSADGVEITIVIDEHGDTSLDTLGGSSKPSPVSKAPTIVPEQRLQQALDLLPDFGRVTLKRVSLTILRTRESKVIEHARLDGIEIDALSRGDGSARQVALQIGTRSAPLAAQFEHDAGRAEGKLYIELEWNASRAELHAAALLDRQTFGPMLPKSGTVLAIDAKASAERGKLHVALEKLDVLARALEASGVVDVEKTRVHVERASGKLEAERFVNLAPHRLPFELKRAGLKFDTVGLEVAEEPSLAPQGKLEVDGNLAGLRWAHEANSVAIEQAKVELRGKPTAAGGLHLEVISPEAAVHVAVGARAAELSGVSSTVNATFEPNAPDHIDEHLKAAHVKLSGPEAIDATMIDLSAKLSELQFVRDRPLESDGALSVALAIGTLDGRARGFHGKAADARLTARTHASKGVLGPIEIELPIGNLALFGAREAELIPPGPAKLSAKLDKLHEESGDAKLDVAIGPLAATAIVHKHPDDLEYEVQLDAKKTSLLTAFAPESLALPGGRMSLTLASRGRVGGLKGSLRLTQKLAAHLDRPAATLRDQTLSATALELSLDSDGGLHRQEITVAIQPTALALDDSPLGDGVLRAHAVWDGGRAIALELDGAGAALPSGKLALKAAFEPKSGALDYQVDGELGHLAAVSPFLPESITDEHWLDLSDLRIKIASRGKLRGVSFSASALERLRGEDTLDVGLTDVRYSDAAGVELAMPAIDVKVAVTADGPRRVGRVEAEVAQASLTTGGKRLDVKGFHEQLDVTLTGDPRAGTLDIKHKIALGSLSQDLFPEYPVGGLQMDASARRTGDGAFHLDSFTLANTAGGTRLALSGGLLLPRGVSLKAFNVAQPLVGFRSMNLKIVLDQRLEAFRGRGAIKLDAQVATGDLRRFHAAAKLKFDRAGFDLNRFRTYIVGLDGELPVVEDVQVDRGKWTILPTAPNNYAQLRFSDQQPFLTGPGALKAERVTVYDLAFEDIAGNLRVTRNQFSIDQVEAKVRSGRIAGQALVDVRGANSSVQLRLRASNIEATARGQKERFDGSAAIGFQLRTRELDGRAEILRIGRPHLLAILDEYDPHHTDTPTNRVRRALEFGYPDRVRLYFDRGFASLSIELGGLARLVKIDEIHGIPIGPLVERYLGPVLSSSE